MFKFLKEPANQKLAILLLIFIISFISFMLTDYIVCKVVIWHSAEFKSISSPAAFFMYQKHQIALMIKVGISLLGFACFLFVARQLFAIVSGLEKIQDTLKYQNFKIIKKSIEL